MKYASMLTEGYAETNRAEKVSRLEYLSEYIFAFTTYQSDMAELFAAKAVEVCEAINNSKTFDYIKDDDQRRWYLLMVNMPFFASKIEWGTSIRGAWWNSGPKTPIQLCSVGLWLDGEQLYEPMFFTHDEWREFIAAVIAFAREDT